MRAILSSKYLADKLNKINLSVYPVAKIKASGNKLYLCSNRDYSILTTLDCETNATNGINITYDQSKVRYDCIKETLNLIPEQPITLIIDNNVFIIELDF